MTSRLSEFYADNFRRRPVVTLCVLNASLGSLGDIIAQFLPVLLAFTGSVSGGNKGERDDGGVELDFGRLLRCVILNLILTPIGVWWGTFLEEKFKAKDGGEDERVKEKEREVSQGDEKAKAKGEVQDGPAGGKKDGSGKKQRKQWIIILQKLALDQFVQAPISLALYLFLVTVLEVGPSSPFQIVSSVGQKYRDLYWPIMTAGWKVWPAVQLISYAFLPFKYQMPFGSFIGFLWGIYMSYINSTSKAQVVVQGQQDAQFNKTRDEL